MNKAQRQTNAVIKQHVIDSLARVSEDDENMDAVTSAVETMKLDTSAVDIKVLYEDKRLQAAFRKFIRATVGTFQYLEAEDSECSVCGTTSKAVMPNGMGGWECTNVARCVRRLGFGG